jgi:hypothetical protein
MDKSIPTENPELEESSAGDKATRKIDPDELFAALEDESAPPPEPATEILTQSEGSAATVILPDIPEPAPAARTTAEPPPAPVAPPKPVSPPPPAPGKENRISVAVIIAISVVALVCICACTIVALTALAVLPSL